MLAWVGITLTWGEPFTALASARAQAALRTELARKKTTALDDAESGPRSPALEGRRSAESSCRGSACAPSSSRGPAPATSPAGPGHYRITALPGSGGTVAIAGPSDDVRSALPPPRRPAPGRPHRRCACRTGRFATSSTRRRIVDDRDWSILRSRPFEKLVLTACHPLYSAAQRFVVFARLQSDRRTGRSATTARNARSAEPTS